MHETLVSKEELFRVVELKKYFKIPSESQGLEYDKYLLQGGQKNKGISKMSEYTSENTTRLNQKDLVKLLHSLPEIEQELKDYKR